MKDVIIKIKGTQGMDSDSEVIELTTMGSFEKSDGKYILCYDESEMLGVNNVLTRLTADGNSSVIMERSGELSSKLIIENGVRNTCFYSTPHGDLVIGIFGETVKNSLNDNGGELIMSYTLDQNLQPISRNTVEISVKMA